mmetsp:Transcript_4762/g.17860  ORF Transcript_4762/g.17860 Transcript_4762/m.17860 type:complete len:382 (+) Transcript_4762:1-1146(+)
MSSPQPISPDEQSLPFSDDQLSHLSLFCDYISKYPDIIHHSKLAFFKTFLLEKGCTEISQFKLNLNVTKDAKDAKNPQEPKRRPIIQELTSFEREEEKAVEDLEKEAELPKHYLSNMGDTFIPTKESTKDAVEVKQKAVQAFREGSFEKSALLFGRAIYLGGGKFHPLFMKRAECLFEMKKYMSARRDATKSIDLNEENHRAYKVRGKANAALNSWPEAVHDFEKALKYDSSDNDLMTLLEEARKQSPDASKSIYYSTKPKMAVSKKSTTKPATKLTTANSTTTVTSKKPATNLSQPHSQGGENHQHKVNLNKDLSEKEKLEAVHKIHKDQKLLKSFTDPAVSKMLDEITKDPKKYFEYQKTNPEIAQLFGGFMNLMSRKQ